MKRLVFEGMHLISTLVLMLIGAALSLTMIFHGYVTTLRQPAIIATVAAIILGLSFSDEDVSRSRKFMLIVVWGGLALIDVLL